MARPGQRPQNPIMCDRRRAGSPTIRSSRRHRYAPRGRPQRRLGQRIPPTATREDHADTIRKVSPILMRSRSLSEHTDLPLPGRPGASAGARHSHPSWAGFDAELFALRVLHHCVTGMVAHDGRSQPLQPCHLCGHCTRRPQVDPRILPEAGRHAGIRLLALSTSWAGRPRCLAADSPAGR